MRILPNTELLVTLLNSSLQDLTNEIELQEQEISLLQEVNRVLSYEVSQKKLEMVKSSTLKTSLTFAKNELGTLKAASSSLINQYSSASTLASPLANRNIYGDIKTPNKFIQGTTSILAKQNLRSSKHNKKSLLAKNKAKTALKSFLCSHIDQQTSSSSGRGNRASSKFETPKTKDGLVNLKNKLRFSAFSSFKETKNIQSKKWVRQQSPLAKKSKNGDQYHKKRLKTIKNIFSKFPSRITSKGIKTRLSPQDATMSLLHHDILPEDLGMNKVELSFDSSSAETIRNELDRAEEALNNRQTTVEKHGLSNSRLRGGKAGLSANRIHKCWRSQKMLKGGSMLDYKSSKLIRGVKKFTEGVSINFGGIGEVGKEGSRVEKFKSSFKLE